MFIVGVVTITIIITSIIIIMRCIIILVVYSMCYGTPEVSHVDPCEKLGLSGDVGASTS